VRWYDVTEGVRLRREALMNRFVSFARQKDGRLQTAEAILTWAKESHELGYDANNLLNEYVKNRMSEERGVGASSVLWEYRALSAFFRCAGILVVKPRSLRIHGNTVDEHLLLTQQQVKRMVAACLQGGHPRRFLWRTLIAVLAQTGQRQSIVRALTPKMIEREICGGYGVVFVPPDLKGNKGRREYRFIIGKQALRLIDERITTKGLGGTDRIFQITEVQADRIVEKVAAEVGIQRVKQTKGGRKWHQVHPHTFRSYWEHQMNEGGAGWLVKFMMGHDPGPYFRCDLNDMFSAYKKVEPSLRVF
jgi:integrase